MRVPRRINGFAGEEQRVANETEKRERKKGERERESSGGCETKRKRAGP